jgi:hypothetical protein
MASQLEELCGAVVPAQRDFDMATCMADTSPLCDEMGPGGVAVCLAFCTATLALCTTSDKCTDSSTWCPKVLCSIGVQDFCPQKAEDWCDLGTGLDGIDLATNQDGSGSLGFVECDGSSRTFTLGKDLHPNDRIWWKCRGTDAYYEANEFVVNSDVTLQTEIERKCNPWCEDSCRLYWSWGPPPWRKAKKPSVHDPRGGEHEEAGHLNISRHRRASPVAPSGE